MAAEEVTKPGQLRRRVHHANHDPLQAARDTSVQGLEHRVRGLTERDDEHVAIRTEVIKVLGNAQHAALALHVSREGTGDAGFRERLLKNFPGGGAHLPCGVFGHGADYSDAEKAPPPPIRDLENTRDAVEVAVKSRK